MRGYPSIKFFPANKKGTPIDYKGDRSKEDFIKFLKENSESYKTFLSGKQDLKSEL